MKIVPFIVIQNDMIIDEMNKKLCVKDQKIAKKNTMKKQKTIMEL